jgi:hypothetical protein
MQPDTELRSYDSGFAIIADPEAHRRALATTPAHYLLRSPKGDRHASDWVPESSRRARAFPVYSVIRALGRKGIADMVDRSCALARRAADRLRVVSGIEILNEVVLNQVLLRFLPDPASDPSQIEAFTLEIVRRVQADGTCWVGHTQWQGRTAMRISVSNWSTSESDIDRSVEAIHAAYVDSLSARPPNEQKCYSAPAPQGGDVDRALIRDDTKDAAVARLEGQKLGSIDHHQALLRIPLLQASHRALLGFTLGKARRAQSS